LNMEVKTAGGTVTLESVSEIVYVKIDGEDVFRGPARTLADILKRDRDYMNWVDSHDADGNQKVSK